MLRGCKQSFSLSLSILLKDELKKNKGEQKKRKKSGMVYNTNKNKIHQR